MQLKLSINEPCHQNWQHMTPTEQGRYCNACAKEVVDFTAMSDTEVLHYFINKKQEKVCGQMYADQLNRVITKPVFPEKKIMWYWNYFVLLLMLLFKGNVGKAQATLPKQIIEQVNGNDINKMLQGRLGCGVVKGSLFDISGKIKDAEGKPVAGATVMINGTKTGTSTNQEGVYNLKNVTVKDVLRVSAVGYISKDIIINNTGSNDCILKEAKLGEVVMVGAISYGDDYIPLPIPTHVAVIEVRDNKTSLPVKASITIENNAIAKTKKSITNSNGIYKLRRIKETENYTVTISAQGYQDYVLHINGNNFTERKEIKSVLLQTQQVQKPTRIIMGSVSTVSSEPMCIIDGVPADKETMKNINPDDIESIDILKNVEMLAIYGSPAAKGVILITTKKKKTNSGIKKVVPEKQAASSHSNITTVESNIRITPNPVKRGSTFSISFTTKAENHYTLRILNETGSVMQLQKLIATAHASTLQLHTGLNWLPGIYYLQINDAGNNIIGTAGFIVE